MTELEQINHLLTMLETRIEVLEKKLEGRLHNIELRTTTQMKTELVKLPISISVSAFLWAKLKNLFLNLKQKIFG